MESRRSKCRERRGWEVVLVLNPRMRGIDQVLHKVYGVGMP